MIYSFLFWVAAPSLSISSSWRKFYLIRSYFLWYISLSCDSIHYGLDFAASKMCMCQLVCQLVWLIVCWVFWGASSIVCFANPHLQLWLTDLWRHKWPMVLHRSVKDGLMVRLSLSATSNLSVFWHCSRSNSNHGNHSSLV